MWVGTEIGLNKYDSQKFRTFYSNPADGKSLLNDNITTLFEDTNLNLLVGTYGGLHIYTRKNSTFRRFENKSLRNNKILAITQYNNETWVLTTETLVKLNSNLSVEKSYSLNKINNQIGLRAWGSAKFDKTGQLWISTNKGLRKFDKKLEKLTNPLEDFADIKIRTVDFYSNIYFDTHGNLWLGTRGSGLKYYSFTKHKWKEVQGLSSKYINGIIEDAQKNIWISTGRNGLNIYDPATQKVEIIKYADISESNLISNSLSCIYGDSMGGIWLGTFNNGLLYYYQHQLRFNLYFSKGQISGINSNYITAFAPDKRNNIWVGAGEEGLLYFNSVTKTFKKIQPDIGIFKTKAELKENFYILSLHLTADQEHLLIGTLTGLFDYNIITKKWHFYLNNQFVSGILQGGYISSIISDGEMAYLATLNGMSTYNTRTQKIENYKTATRQLGSLVQNKGNLLIGTRTGGLWNFNKTNKMMVKVNPKGISIPQRIRSLFLDAKDRLIIGTDQEGIFRVSKNFDKIEQIQNSTKNERLVFMSICDDPNGGYWSTTNKGLVKISENFQIENIFDSNDGFNPSYFTQNSLKKANNNDILVGGNAGFYSFSPKNFFTPKNAIPKVHIIDFLILNRSVVGENAEGFNIPGELDNLKKISLPKYQNLVTFEYTALDFHNPSNGEFAYKLEPYDFDWNLVGNRRYATYRDLPAGTYKFKVKFLPSHAEINKGIYTELELVIPAIWWQTWWAYSIYSALLFLILRQFYIYRRNKRILSQEIEMQKFRHEKAEELYDFKLDFFTQVTHELRTPLTLIISPLEEIINRSKNTSERNLLTIIHRNTQKLLLKVNQILDFRKIENADMKVFAKKGNIVSFAEEILYSFLPIAEKKGIELLFETNMEKYPFVLFDKDIMEKIIINLVSNAIKFTQQGSVVVKVYESEEYKNPTKFTIEIADTGQGIKPENMEKVFDSFFQEKRDSGSVGSGIGLKIVKELTSLHKGILELKSEYQIGTRFLLNFPKADLDLLNEEDLKPNISKEKEFDNSPSILHQIPEDQLLSTTKILLIDDEPDVLDFLKEIFMDNYNVITADNPKKALELARVEMPDLIISDVMMPEMNGFELCEIIKTDFLLGHIPVLLLTALNATEHEIEGLKNGADAYISKPFSVNLLKAKTQNLLATRLKLKQAFLNSSINSVKDLTSNNADKIFIEKVIDLIDAKLDKTDLEIADISEDLGMSQSTFYRKLKSLTDLSGNEFIRTIRLKRSIDFLKNTNLNISEIAYRVGFSDPKYFSTSFRKFYNITPTDYISMNRNLTGHLDI
jgi:signal transduction histidine kinase/ligand-binding sensor domain-containing protein/DNA-binding response OmpR family regulator